MQHFTSSLDSLADEAEVLPRLLTPGTVRDLAEILVQQHLQSANIRLPSQHKMTFCDVTTTRTHLLGVGGYEPEVRPPDLQQHRPVLGVEAAALLLTVLTILRGQGWAGLHFARTCCHQDEVK